MTPEQFCYWLQGRAELSPATPTDAEWQSIRDHLATVFDKVTPPGPVDTLRQELERLRPRRLCQTEPFQSHSPEFPDYGRPRPTYRRDRLLC